LQVDGGYAVTMAQNYQEAVSAITEYNFNAAVLPRKPARSLEAGRVALALKLRYRGERHPYRTGVFVDRVNKNLAHRWPGGSESWRVLSIVKPAEASESTSKA